jgi:cell division topological specificity factor
MALLLMDRLFGKKTPSANVARERLQIILAHERAQNSTSTPDYLPALQAELIAVISKYVQISPDDIKVQLERQGNMEVLDLNIILGEKI